MRVLGFDPSLTNFGWALVDTDNPTLCLERGRFQTSSRTLFVDRYVDLRTRVVELVQRLQVPKIGVEYPVFGEQYSPGLYGLFLYTCEALRTTKCDVVFFSPGQAKAHARVFLGRPEGWKMEKPDMVEAARKLTGHKGSKRSFNHNEADALWIAYTASRFWSLQDSKITEQDLTPLEREQFVKVHTYMRGKKKGRTVKSGISFREDERFFRWSKQE